MKFITLHAANTAHQPININAQAIVSFGPAVSGHTIITLTGGVRHIVTERSDEVYELIKEALDD